MSIQESYKKISILGSSGQIGAYLAKYLIERGYEVDEIDIVKDEKDDLRVTDSKKIDNTIKNSDFVFFLAFDVGGSPYLDKYQHTFDFINNNSYIMSNTFSILNKYSTPFIFASSQMSNMTHSPYGVLKNIGELYTKSINGLIVKFWNVFGIENDPEKSHVITDFIRKAMDNDEVYMRTDGTEEREFLYAEDCCEALEALMKNFSQTRLEEELHVTSFQSSTILEVAKIVTEVSGKNVKFIPANKKDKIQLNMKNKANEKIRKWWSPKTTLYDGISKVWHELDLKKDR